MADLAHVLDHRGHAVDDPRTVHAIGEDYRAGARVDVGRTVTAPTLALWQDPGGTPLPFDPLQVWRRWTRILTPGVVAPGTSCPRRPPTSSPTTCAGT